METPVVKTNFIPKKVPVPSRQQRRFQNVFLWISILLIFGSISAWGGFMFYKDYLEKEKMALQSDLERVATENINLKLVDDLGTLDKRLNAADKLLNSHTISSPIFDFLGDETLTSEIRYSSFRYRAEEGGLHTVSLAGKAASFNSLGYQKQVLDESKLIVNPEFSNFAINDETGDVVFNLVFYLNPSLVSYRIVTTGDDLDDLIEDDE